MAINANINIFFEETLILFLIMLDCSFMRNKISVSSKKIFMLALIAIPVFSMLRVVVCFMMNWWLGAALMKTI